MEKEVALVYMVAGMSSRFGGKLKWLEKVGPEGESLIGYSMKQAIPAGFSKIVLIVGKQTIEPFKEAFGDSYMGVPILYALQEYDVETRDKPWGTVDAVCSAKKFLNCPFVVCNGDDLYGSKGFSVLVNHLKSESECASIGHQLKNVLGDTPNNRGVMTLSDANYVTSINENYGLTLDILESRNLTGEMYCSMTLFGLHPEALDLLAQTLEEFKREHEGDRKIECLLPNHLSKLLESGKIKIKLYPAEEKHIGLTAPGDEVRIKQFLSDNPAS